MRWHSSKAAHFALSGNLQASSIQMLVRSGVGILCNSAARMLAESGYWYFCNKETRCIGKADDCHRNYSFYCVTALHYRSIIKKQVKQSAVTG
ncbi:MAG: hypothetical protein RKH07_07465 [Gammaproteobacteria bacterium]